jgi:DNA invertase Pin-like site-specific DNA recombinase
MAVALASGSNSTGTVSPRTRVAIYVRISSDPKETGLGVKRQERECRELCRRLGLTVVAVFVDDDRSAFSGKPRPEYIAMLERLELGDFGAIVAWHPDRLHRSPVELESFIDLLERSKATVLTVQGGDYDLSTAGGRMTARVVGAVARHESEHKSERVKAKFRELVDAGKPIGGWGGSRAYGHEAHTKGQAECPIRPDEAAIVRELVRRFLAGESISGLTKDLNARKVPTVSGGPWRTCTVRQILQSPRIAGLREYDGQLLPAPCASIIDADEYHMVCARLDANAQAGRRAPRRFLLTGIATCGCEECGKPLVGKTIRRWPAEETDPKYVCVKERDGCGRLAVLAVPVEDRVKKALFDFVDSPDFGSRLDRSDGQPAELHDQLEAIERRMDELATTYGAGEITKREWIAARTPLESKLKALREASARRTEDQARSTVLDRWKDGDRSLAADWPSLRLDQQRAIVAAAFKAVVIAPADRHGARLFDSRRVTIERRF